MRAILDFLINLYLLPLRLNNRIALYVKGKVFRYDEHFIIALDVIKNTFPNDTGLVADVGAFDADSTVYLAERLPGNRIIGFEPNPGPFEQAVKNARNYSNVEIENIGFSEQAEEADFYVTDNLVSSSLYRSFDQSEFRFDKKIKVNLLTLDQFFRNGENILLLKLDVQGAELKILKGATQTLTRTKLVLTEVIISDFYDGGCFYFEIDDYMRGVGFKIHSIICNYNNQGSKYFDILYINQSLTNPGDYN